MNWLHEKDKFEESKNWIITNQSLDGYISWDEKGKCDPWDHCECLIALSIYKEWDAFWLGVQWFFDNINDEGLIYAEFQKGKPSKKHFESHHAPYIILPLIQASLIDKKQDYHKVLNQTQLDKLNKIFKALKNFKIRMVFIIGQKMMMDTLIIRLLQPQCPFIYQLRQKNHWPLI